MENHATTRNSLDGTEVCRTLIAILVAFSLFPADAHAYLDAGTGSMIIQMLVAGAAAALVLARTYWTRIKSFFGRKSLEASADDEGNGGN